MDRHILKLERSLASHPENDVLRDRLLCELKRSGRYYDARKLISRRLSQRIVTTKDLQNLVELGRLTGFINSYPARSSTLMNFSALFHAKPRALTDVEIEIGFASIEGAGALMSVLALADFFGCSVTGLAGSGLHGAEFSEMGQEGSRQLAPVLEIQKPSETVYEFRLELHDAPVLSSRFRLRAIRVTTIPIAASKVTLRRKVLRSVNALAFVADTRSDGTGQTNEEVFHRLNRDFEELWGRRLDGFRIALQYLEPTRKELHRALLTALGLSRSPRIHANIETTAKPAPRPQPLFTNFQVGRNQILAHEGVLDTFALLLLRAISDLSRV